MKKIIVIIISMSVLLVLLWWVWTRNEIPLGGREYSETKSKEGQQEEPTGNRPASSANTVGSLEPSQLDRLREIAVMANKPIKFYGRVVDQNDAPIPGVKITLQIRAMKEAGLGVIADLFEDTVVLSDASGRFSLVDSKGSVLTVKALEKTGYEPSKKSTNRSFRYWDNENVRYKPDAAEPEIFRMWKKGTQEPLLRGNKFYGIVPDGRMYTIDLLRHLKIEGDAIGDFRVAIHRPSEVQVGSKYGWKCIMVAIDGGLIESDAEQMYLAPETGYQQQYHIEMAVSHPDWEEKAKRQLYLRSRGGEVYARLEVEVYANYQDKAVFSVEYYANPSGSRNLEYDPLQGMVKPPTPAQ